MATKTAPTLLGWNRSRSKRQEHMIIRPGGYQKFALALCGSRLDEQCQYVPFFLLTRTEAPSNMRDACPRCLDKL